LLQSNGRTSILKLVCVLIVQGETGDDQPYPVVCCGPEPVLVGRKDEVVEDLEEVDGLIVKKLEGGSFTDEDDWAMAPAARDTRSNALMEGIFAVADKEMRDDENAKGDDESRKAT
jgi:hypothetical protein